MHRHASGSVDFGELIMAFEALNTQPQVIFRFYAYCFFFGGCISTKSKGSVLDIEQFKWKDLSEGKHWMLLKW